MNIVKSTVSGLLAFAVTLWLCGSAAVAAPHGSCTGKIDHNSLHKGQSGTCSVDVLPTTVEEFKELQAQVATEPQGAVLCFAAAMNIYANDPEAGKTCLELASYHLGGSEMSLLRDKLQGSDSYCQKYLPMAVFKGATPENGYTPDKPYTVEVSVNNGRPYSELTDAEAPVIYLNYKTKGTDMGSRTVSVIQPWDSKYFVTFERGGMYMQVKNIKHKRQH